MVRIHYCVGVIYWIYFSLNQKTSICFLDFGIKLWEWYFSSSLDIWIQKNHTGFLCIFWDFGSQLHSREGYRNPARGLWDLFASDKLCCTARRILHYRERLQRRPAFERVCRTSISKFQFRAGHTAVCFSKTAGPVTCICVRQRSARAF